MRLTLVSETFPPDVNGVAKTLGRWVNTFRSRGHEVQVIRPRRAGERPRTDRVLAIPLPFYPEVRLGLAGRARLRSLFTRFRSDLVHIATPGPLGLAALLAARRTCLPIASSFHTSFDIYLGYYGLALFKPFLSAYLRWFHNCTAVTLAPSRSICERLQALGYERVELWSRGIDGTRFHPRFRDWELRRSLGLGPGDCLVLYVGRLALEKGLPVLLEAFGRAHQRVEALGRQRVLLALVGGGPLAEGLKSQALPDVVFAGFQDGEDLARWYASADVFAFPSLSETFGNVVLEAQASGLPVVGFDDATLRERVQHGQDGLLVDPRLDLATALLQLCQEEESRRRLGQAARRRAELQDWESIFDLLEKRYLQLAGDRSMMRNPADQAAGWPGERGRTETHQLIESPAE